VTWTPEGDGVVIQWREFAGPVVSRPTRRGFGSRLIEQALPREMAGEARLSFEPAGLQCRMRFPFSAKLSLAT
jgi:two-component sensor histidine kinase